MKSPKLNTFQRGLLQKSTTCIAYAICATSVLLFLDWLNKARFIGVAERAQNQNIINQDMMRQFKIIINAQDASSTFFGIMIGLACAYVIWLFLRRVAGLNWSWPITLENAVEFSTAMRKMDKLDFADQMAYIQKYHLPVYIADAPIHGESREKVRAKLYPYAHSDVLVLESVMTANIGKRRLCLAANDYEPLYKQYNQMAQVANRVKVAELERNIDALKAALSLKEDDCVKLSEECKQLIEENKKYKAKEQTASGRDANIRNNDLQKIPFWRVAGPLINRLITEAEPATRYTRPQIQAEFLKELEKHPWIDTEAKSFFLIPQNESDGAIYDLRKWAMEAIRDGLGAYANRESGAPRKAASGR